MDNRETNDTSEEPKCAVEGPSGESGGSGTAGPLQQGGEEIRAEKWIYGGDTLSRLNGRVILTPFLLPGEIARVRTSPYKAGLLTGKLLEIAKRSPLRVEAPCPYFGRCGGCQYQHAPYEYQLEQKREILREVLRRVGKLDAPEEIQIVAGEPWQYRNRSQFHLDRGEIGYLEAGSHRLCPVEQCPISSPRLNEALAVLRQMRSDRRFPSFVRSIEFFTNETEVQVNVRETDRPVARGFFEWCQERIPGAAAPSLDYSVAGHLFRVSHRSFFQVNRHLTGRLVEEAIPVEGGEWALDLYAGVGLFTLPLAKKFLAVTAVEGSLSATRDLEVNAARAGVDVRVERSAVDLFLEKLGERPDLLFADPPRAGLGKTVVREILRLKPPRIVLVACDPSTLARDLAPLIGGGYALRKLTMVDLFPQTFHLETVAVLSR